jgi:hypothetical protein
MINFAETQLAPVRAQQGQYIPEDVKRQLLAAQLLQQTASDTTAPVYSKGLGMAKLLAGGLGGLMEGYEQNKENTAQKESYAKLASVLSPGSEAPAPAADSGGGLGAFLGKLLSGKSDAPAPAPEPAPATVAEAPVKPAAFAPAELAAGLEGKSPPKGSSPFSGAIAGIESGGSKDPYTLLGPVTKTGDRAYGKYQVMGANVPSWTKEVLGKEMTPADFAADPQAQEAVFNAKFGALAQKYGPEGAAKAWFAGEGGMNNPNAKDILGTSVAQYAQKFNALNGGQAPAPASAAPPQQVAQAPQAQGTPPVQPRPPIDPRAVMQIVQDPRIPPELKQYLLQQSQPQNKMVTTPDGTTMIVDERTGAYKTIYQAPVKATAVKDEESLRNPVTGALIAPSVYQQSVQAAATAAQQPGPNGQPSAVIPPPPPGSDPKAWTKGYTDEAAKNAAKGSLPAGAPETAEVRKEVMRLPSYQNYSSAMPIYRSMLETSGRDSKASDLNLVYGLGKILDPNSVVREGELVMAKNTASLPDFLVGAINSLNGGAALTPETRQAILKEAYGRMQSYEVHSTRTPSTIRALQNATV